MGLTLLVGRAGAGVGQGCVCVCVVMALWLAHARLHSWRLKEHRKGIVPER